MLDRRITEQQALDMPVSAEVKPKIDGHNRSRRGPVLGDFSKPSVHDQQMTVVLPDFAEVIPVELPVDAGEELFRGDGLNDIPKVRRGRTVTQAGIPQHP
jgi:hypothetical protein